MKRLFTFFSSSTLALILLVLFAIAMAVATFVENDFGTSTAWAIIYDAWWFEAIMIALCLAFIANIYKYNLLRKEKWAVLLFHLAFVVTVIGAGITRHSSYGGVMRIREGASSHVIISSDNYLSATIRAGDKTKQIQKRMALSPIKNNDFSIDKDFGNNNIRISYDQFIPDAVPKITEDPDNGQPLLEIVVSAGNGKKTLHLNKGDTETIGKVTLGYESNKDGIINIKQKDESFYLYTPYHLDFFIMASQKAGILKADSIYPMTLRTLYRAGDVSFVPRSFTPQGVFQYTTGAEKPKDNDEGIDDILSVHIEINGKRETKHLTYRKGFLPEITTFNVDGMEGTLSYGSRPIIIPFDIRLDDFQLERYPGSSSPSSYASEVTVIDNGNNYPHRIFMNNVLDYGGYRFFQASYDTDEKGTVLSVNHDSLGTWITYVGYFLLGLGMLFTLFGKQSRFQQINRKLKKLKNQHKKLASIILVMAYVLPSYAIENPSQNDSTLDLAIKSQYIDPSEAEKFGRLMVQDLDGRIKPINTLASEFIRKISRKSSFQYIVDDQEIRYSVDQIFLSMHIAPHIWQRIPIIKVDLEKIQGILPETQEKSNGRIAFSDLVDTTGKYLLTEYVEFANQKKPAERDETDKEVLKLDEKFNILYGLFMGKYLKIFPRKDDPNQTWYSYSDDLKDFNQEDALFVKSIIPSYFKSIVQRDTALSYENLNYIRKYQEILGSSIIPDKQRVEAELWYNKINLNFWLFQLFFTIGLIMLILAFLKIFSDKKWVNFLWNVFTIITLAIFLCFTANILLRWYIAQHAPWSNGYEMLVFVAWTLILCGLITFRKSDFSLPLATLFSGALLFVSYLDWLNPEITNLMPVLKSYWLKIHVATIVSSYAPLALSCVIGMMALILTIVKTPRTASIIDTKIKELGYINEMSMTIGLFVLTIGTFLGGVWANESWGRYWAWDPKETWALISIIVYAIVLHLRFVPALNNHFTLNVASMVSFWSIIMTSFGVNYYLSGLHSYAAGDPMPIPKFVYYLAAFMTILIIVAYIRYNKNKKSQSYKSTS